jgi:hypothetical protein
LYTRVVLAQVGMFDQGKGLGTWIEPAQSRFTRETTAVLL